MNDLAPLLSQLAAVDVPTVTGLLNFGAVGMVLAWILVQSNPRLDRIERGLDRLTRAQMLTLLARPDTEEPVKEQVRAVLDELNGQGKTGK